MRKVLLICLMILTGMYSCKKSSKTTSGTLSGIYTESSPVSGGSQLNFASSTMVIKSEPGYPTQDSFYYTLSSGKIWLTPAWSTVYPATGLDFVVIDNNTIRIENLNASIPEDPKIYMIFKK